MSKNALYIVCTIRFGEGRGDREKTNAFPTPPILSKSPMHQFFIRTADGEILQIFNSREGIECFLDSLLLVFGILSFYSFCPE